MNLANIVGGGMIAVALGWFARMLVLYFIPIPISARIFAIILDLGSGLSGIGVGIAILAGDVGPFGITTEVYAAAFVAFQFIGAWGFAISILVSVFRNNTLVETCVLDDTNERVRESQEEQKGIVQVTKDTNIRVRETQGRGKDERPGVVRDQTEGHESVVSINFCKLMAR